MRDDKGAGPSTPENGIVLAGEPHKRTNRRQVPALAGCVLCALGGVAAYFLQPAASLLVGLGALAAGAGRSKALKALLAVCTLALAGLGGIAFGVAGIPDALICCGIGLASAFLVDEGKMTSGVACIAVAAVAALLLGAGELVAQAQGMTLSAQVTGLLDQYLQAMGSAAGLTAADTSLVEHLVGLLWPVAYTVTALLEFLCAYAGAAFAAQRRQSPRVEAPRFAEFDLPLWVVAIFVASVAGLAAGLSVPVLSGDPVLMVMGTLLLSLRFAFAAQGFAVLVWVVQRRKASSAAFALALVAAAYLEAQFIVMSIVGLLDVWSNFRRLPRGKKVTVQDGPMQQ